MNYLNELIKNYPLDSEDSFKYFQGIQIGGNRHEPSGSFPPIYYCPKNELIDKDITYNKPKKKRETKGDDKTISISEIMKERRNITPFISI